MTGEPAYGFEIEIRGMTSASRFFTWNRHGAPPVTPFADGIYVRYPAPWDPATQQFVTSTIPAVHPTATAGHSCLLGTPNYDTNGCGHFGGGGWPTPTIPAT